MSEFLRVLSERGFVADCTNLSGIEEELKKGPLTAYVGFDATAKSLHVGHLANIMMLRWLEKAGGNPIVLLGEGTSLVGDPSFRSAERPMLTAKDVTDNVSSMGAVFYDMLDTVNKTKIVSNGEWLSSMSHLDFMRDIGRHFSVARMLSFESVKTRLGEGLSFLEFGYMLLQAADFLHLFEREGCRLQMGGSDQWGNILNGVDLVRKVHKEEVFGLTCPLLTRHDGKKMGKSGGQAVWLRADMTSDFDFWQFWRNTPDEDVKRFLLLFTELDKTECERLGGLRGNEINAAKSVLADEITTLVRGPDATKRVKAGVNAVAGSEESGIGLPVITVAENTPLFRALVISGLAESGKAAKRQMADGASWNGVKMTDPDFPISGEGVLSVGKRRVFVTA